MDPGTVCVYLLRFNLRCGCERAAEIFAQRCVNLLYFFLCVSLHSCFCIHVLHNFYSSVVVRAHAVNGAPLL